MYIVNKTKKEQELINIAVKIIDCFDSENVVLGGSLALSQYGIRKRRESNDIDIIFLNGEDVSYYYLVHRMKKIGFDVDVDNSKLHEEKCDSYTDNVISILLKNGLKIDFLFTDNYNYHLINGISCSSIQDILMAKYNYMCTNSKHAKDLYYMFHKNPLLAESILKRFYEKIKTIFNEERVCNNTNY